MRSESPSQPTAACTERMYGCFISSLVATDQVSYYNSLAEVHPSARKHGIADEDIEHAMAHAMKMRSKYQRLLPGG